MTSLPSLPPDSSSSSSPSLPFRPFSRLPTELVQHIIASTVPSYYHSTTYSERQTSLAHLSLVSRLFRQIAQPLLSSVVAPNLHQNYDRLATRLMNTEAAGIRELVLHSRHESGVLRGTCSLLAGVRSVSIGHWVWKNAVALLTCLPNLTVFRLGFMEVTQSVFDSLLRIKVLHLVRMGPTELLPRIFNPSTLPSLRALACYFLSGDFPTGSAAQINQLISPFAVQLEVLSVNHELIRESSKEVNLVFQDKTLVDARLRDCSHGLDRAYVRLTAPGVATLTNRSEGHLQELENRLHNLPTQQTPSLLYLPPYSTALLEVSKLTSVRAKLSQTCDEKGIEVIHEEQPQNWASDLGISQDFWRKMKEVKAKGGKE